MTHLITVAVTALPAAITADILDPIVRVATDFIDSAGLAGVFVLMTLESACIPIPSEAIMLFAGFNVSQGTLTLLGVVAAGVAGNVVGSLLAYAAGYWGRLELLERNRLIHISPAQLARADSWFERYGSVGVARMPLGRFTALTAAGSLPWVLMLALIGREVGDNWESWRKHLHYADYAIVALVVVGIVYLLIRRRRGTDAWGRTPPA